MQEIAIKSLLPGVKLLASGSTYKEVAISGEGYTSQILNTCRV